MIDGYYNRFDPAKKYEKHLFRAGYVLQSSELNEVQSYAEDRVRGVADALFKDGDVVRDAQIIVNSATGEVQCQSGAIYLIGAVRGIPSKTMTIPTTGVVSVGIRLVETVITELDDPALRDPAIDVRNYQEAGAARLKVEAIWSFQGDGATGEFYPVYTVEDGQLRAKETPPNLDAVTQSLARYDRDSAGGTYVVSGLTVQAMDDLGTGEQVYSVGEGRARVYGYGVELKTSRREVYPVIPDLRNIISEPHTSTTVSAQRVDTDRTPIENIASVQITAEKTVTLTHGGFVGAQDPLPDTSVLSLLEVKQGGTTYLAGTDYKLANGKVDWSLGGAEPAPGSTYTVKYQYISEVTPTAIDDTGFTVEGAVVGSLILVTYSQKLPRYDRIALNADGDIVWFKGVSAEWNPQIPAVPDNVLPLATVYQDWSATRHVENDGVRVVPMSDLSAINSRIDYMLGLIAQQRLEGSASLTEAGQKKGLFVDPFLDDSLRDAGIAQTCAIFSGELTLPVTIDQVSLMPSDVSSPTSMTNNLSTVLEQSARTGTMKVNPYMAFEPLPASVRLTPAIDNWTVTSTSWASSITQRIVVGSGINSRVGIATSVQTLSRSSRPAEFLRQIDINFTISGFGQNEVLSSVTFDGVAVTPVAS
jgi:hypothetical protein